MWSSDEDKSFSLTSSSSKSSSSSFLPSTPTMEDVWKDISLSNLHDNPSREDVGSKSSFRRVILQEFLARPFRHQKSTTHEPDIHEIHSFPANPPPPTVLSLSTSASDFSFLDSAGGPLMPQQGDSFERAALGSSFCRKRVPEKSVDFSGDTKHKRMIKNRESAARSRARKQAYTNELELEVAQLTEENAKLRKQQQQLSEALLSKVPTKSALQRTLTAPF